MGFKQRRGPVRLALLKDKTLAGWTKVAQRQEGWQTVLKWSRQVMEAAWTQAGAVGRPWRQDQGSQAFRGLYCPCLGRKNEGWRGDGCSICPGRGGACSPEDGKQRCGEKGRVPGAGQGP